MGLFKHWKKFNFKEGLNVLWERLQKKRGSGRERYQRLSFAKKVIFIFSLVLIIFLTLILSYFSFKMWAISPAELELAKLADSWDKEDICHETCQMRRQQISSVIVGDLKKNKESVVTQRLEEYFLSDSVSFGFKENITDILAAGYGPNQPPTYIQSYFNQLDAQPALQASILGLFSPAALGVTVSDVNQAFDTLSGHNPLNDYFLILHSERNLAVKIKAVAALSNATDKEHNFSAEQLLIIRHLILDSLTARRLRQSLVLLLSDYYTFFPAETAEILYIVYDSGVGDDEISRAFSADILNRVAGENLIMPEVSSAAWTEYYNN